MSQQRSSRSQEWTGLLAGGFLGLTLILLANISPIFAYYRDVFATINIFLFLCALFSPFILIHVFKPNRRVFRTITVIIYILSAVLIGFMMAYLTSSDNYYLGPITSKGAFWIAITTAILIIPLIHIFALFPIAVWLGWLGTLIYSKIYSTSCFFKTLIGSPLFAIPILVALGCEISRALRSSQSTAYIFDKTEGTLTLRRLPRGKVAVKNLLAAIIIFLTLGSIVASAFGVWNEIEEANISHIGDFQLSPYLCYEGSYNFYLKVSFSLVNVRGRTIPLEGYAELTLFDKDGVPICNERFSFSQSEFSSQADSYWICTRYLSGQNFISYIMSKARSVTVLPRLAEMINLGYANIKIYLNNGKKNLAAITSIKHLSDICLLMRLYFKNDIAALQAELNKQWSIKARIDLYFKLGNYGWAVVRRTGGEIIFYPKPIYNWYILQSTDCGKRWCIMWGGDDYPTFCIEFLSEKEARITTPYGKFATKNEGETWERLNHENSS